MHTWTFLHLFSDEDGISRVDPHFSLELASTDFAPPAPPMFVSPAADAQAFVLMELPVG